MPFPMGRHLIVVLVGVVFWTGLVCFAQQSEDYEIPDVCDGLSPLLYLGIDTAGTQRVAEYTLAEKLNDPGKEVIQIYCTLIVDNQTYAPGQCPGQPQLSSHTMPGSTVSLSYIYGRPGTFAPIYLAIRAPTRYYSLGILSQKVAWKSDDNQTLSLALANDTRSRNCWQASNTHQRTAFIHRLLNRTLSGMLHRVNRTAQWLDGVLYSRGRSTNNWLGNWPFPFGRSYYYKSCDVTFLPLNVSLDNSSLLNYTLCSEWKALSASYTQIPFDLAIVLNLFFGYVCFAIFFYTWPYLHGKWYNGAVKALRSRFPGLHAERYFEVRNAFRAANLGVNSCWVRDGAFPKELQAARLLQIPHLHVMIENTLNRNAGYWRLLSRRILDGLTVFNHLFFLLAFAVLVIGSLLYLNVGVVMVFDQPYDSVSQLWSPCSPHSLSVYAIICAGFVLATAVVLLAFFWHDYRQSARHKRGLYGLEHVTDAARKRRLVFGFVVSIFAGIAFSVVLMPLIANMVMICGFTLIGLAIYHASGLALLLAFVKLVLFDIMKLHGLDEALSPSIALCKRALDIASRELEEAALADCASEMWSAARNPDAPPVAPKIKNLIGLTTKTQDNYDHHDGKSYQTGTTMSSGSGSGITRLDECTTRAFLLLCKRYNVVTMYTKKNTFDASSPAAYSNDWDEHHVPPDENDPVYRRVWALLALDIIEKFRRHILQSTVAVVAMMVILAMLQLILVHIGDLTHASNWTEFILPGLIFVQGTYQELRRRWKRQAAPEKELVIDAKCLLLLLVATIGDKMIIGQGSISLEDPSFVSGSTNPVLVQATAAIVQDSREGTH